jgi:hypothetical protein
METESSLRNVVLKEKQDDILVKDEIMDNVRNRIFVLMYHRHKPLDQTCSFPTNVPISQLHSDEPMTDSVAPVTMLT